MKGRANILKQPEFSDADKIKSIISKFEDKEFISNIKEEDNGVKVYIGSETEFDDDVTIIKTKYNVNGEEGTLAIVGPKRMEYNRAMMLLEYLKNNISEENPYFISKSAGIFICEKWKCRKNRKYFIYYRILFC